MKWFKNLLVFFFIIRLFTGGGYYRSFHATKVVYNTRSSVVDALVGGKWMTINGTYTITEYDKQEDEQETPGHELGWR